MKKADKMEMCDKNALGELAEEKTEEKKNSSNNCPVEQTPLSEKAKEAEKDFDNAVYGE